MPETVTSTNIEDALLEALATFSKKELREFADLTAATEAKLALAGPQTDDELWQWIYDELGLAIPRVAVCEEHGHCAPFTFLADLFFLRTRSAIGLGNRGGSKTFMVALLHFLNGKFKRNVEALTAGATQEQSGRCYEHLKKLVAKHNDDNILDSLQSVTHWKNGCKVEIVAGTKKAMNGPHPNIVHRDEVDLFDEEAYKEGDNMAQTSVVDGEEIPAQDILTSTRKRKAGKMQKLVNEHVEQVRAGEEPSHDLYIWCIFETARKVPNCCASNPFITPDNGGCNCHTIKNGKWPSGADRTLYDVCKGKFARSDGFITREDVVKFFRKNDRNTWESQVECTTPSTEGEVLPTWDRAIHCIQNFNPDPEQGPIFMGIDFGGTNPHAALWIQHLTVSVNVRNYTGHMVTLPEGAYVIFHEVYKAEISNTAFGRLIQEVERQYRRAYPKFKVLRRFADPAAKAARLEFRDMGLVCSWLGGTRDKKEQVKSIRSKLDNNLLYVDINKAPMTVAEAEAWHYPEHKPGMVDDPEIPVDDFNHAMSAKCYAFINLDKLNRKRRSSGTRAPAPQAASPGHVTATMTLPRSSGVPRSDGTYQTAMAGAIPRSERWREDFFGGVTGGM